MFFFLFFLRLPALGTLWIPSIRITCTITTPLYHNIGNLAKKEVCMLQTVQKVWRIMITTTLIRVAIWLACKSFIYRRSIVFTNADYQINPKCLNPIKSLTRHGASEDGKCSMYWGHKLMYQMLLSSEMSSWGPPSCLRGSLLTRM